jgi:hypothetical protein
MHQAPVFDDACHLARKLAGANFARGYGDQRFKPLVFHMDVWWRMIVVPHADDDSEKYG